MTTMVRYQTVGTAKITDNQAVKWNARASADHSKVFNRLEGSHSELVSRHNGILRYDCCWVSVLITSNPAVGLHRRLRGLRAVTQYDYYTDFVMWHDLITGCHTLWLLHWLNAVAQYDYFTGCVLLHNMISVLVLCSNTITYCTGPRSGKLRTQKLKSHLVRTQSLKRSLFKSLE